jgi:hypothetical protein
MSVLSQLQQDIIASRARVHDPPPPPPPLLQSPALSHFIYKSLIVVLYSPPTPRSTSGGPRSFRVILARSFQRPSNLCRQAMYLGLHFRSLGLLDFFLLLGCLAPLLALCRICCRHLVVCNLLRLQLGRRWSVTAATITHSATQLLCDHPYFGLPVRSDFL